jgi:hypothetical protein
MKAGRATRFHNTEWNEAVHALAPSTHNWLAAFAPFSRHLAGPRPEERFRQSPRTSW